MEVDTEDAKLIADVWRAIAAYSPARRQRLRPRLVTDADQHHGIRYLEQTGPRTQVLRPSRQLIDADQIHRAVHRVYNASCDASPDEPVQPREREPNVFRVNLNSDWRKSLFSSYVMTGGRLRPPW
jgi:hypothetical protein